MDRYEEALAKARELHGTVAAGRDFLAEIFPELRESEDERVRKWIIDEIKATHDYDSPTSRKCVDDALAWLERRKEYPTNEEMLRTLRVEYEKGVADTIAKYEQKEQKQDEGDFTIYHPQKNGDGKYKCIPFSFYGSLTSFSNDKDLMDFLNECFYDKEECERWCEVENKPELPECNHKVKKDSVFDYLCESSGDEKQKEQKPAEWSEEDEDMRYKATAILNKLCASKKEFVWQPETLVKIFYWLKSLRPPQYCENCKLKRSVENWKPSKEQMGMLLAVINDPNNAGAESCQLMLQSLFADLKKL